MIEQLKELIYLRGSIRFGPSHDINTAYAEVHFSGLYNLGWFPYTGICTIQRKIVLLGKKTTPLDLTIDGLTVVLYGKSSPWLARFKNLIWEM